MELVIGLCLHNVWDTWKRRVRNINTSSSFGIELPNLQVVQRYPNLPVGLMLAGPSKVPTEALSSCMEATFLVYGYFFKHTIQRRPYEVWKLNSHGLLTSYKR
jgi:hypothetical protein